MQRPFSAYEGNEPYVFACYAHEDRARVYPEITRLNESGFHIWYDDGIAPGSEWSETLARQIKGCDTFLYFLTPNSVASEHCRREVSFALEQTCSIVAVHLEPTEMPDGLSLSLSNRQAVLQYEHPQASYESKLHRALQSGGRDPGVANQTIIRIGESTLNIGTERLIRGDEDRALDPKELSVLLHLIDRAPDVVATEGLLSRTWPGVVVGDNVLHQAIARLRNALGDDARQPRYIETLPKRGYRLCAEISRPDYRGVPTAVEAAAVPGRASTAEPSPARGRLRQLVSLVALVGILAVAAAWLGPRGEFERGAPITAIAVLPFDDLSQDGAHAWLTNAITEDLIEALSRIDALFVPARHSAAILKNNGADLSTIGDRLVVGSVVEGSVRRVGERINVVARWVRVEDGARLWSARYDRPFDDILVIQLEIATAVAEAIRAELGIQDTPEWLAEDRYSTADVRAWELLKRADFLIETNEPTKIKQARQLLLTATHFDPTFANAQARLAFVDYLSNIERGLERTKLVLQLDPHNPAALATLAWDSAMRFWDYDSAQDFLQRIPQTRKSAQAWGVEFNVYSNLGAHDRSLPAAEQTVRLDPMFARGHCFLGAVHMRQGKEAAAIASFQDAIAVAKENGQWGAYCVSDLAKYYLRSGQEGEPLKLMLDAPQYRTVDDEVIRHGWESGGWKGMHLAIADAYPSAASQDMGWKCDAVTLAEAGALERMYSCLETELEQTAPDIPASTFSHTMRRFAMAGIRNDDAFDPYRTEGRFRNLIHQMNDRIRAARDSYERKTGISVAYQPVRLSD